MRTKEAKVLKAYDMFSGGSKKSIAGNYKNRGARLFQ